MPPHSEQWGLSIALTCAGHHVAAGEHLSIHTCMTIITHDKRPMQNRLFKRAIIGNLNHTLREGNFEMMGI